MYGTIKKCPLAMVQIDCPFYTGETGERKQIMKLPHEAIVGGHMGIRKMSDRITSSVHWPVIISDVARVCRTCDVCQRIVPNGKVSKVPLGKMTIIDKPFKRVGVDLIEPVSSI